MKGLQVTLQAFFIDIQYLLLIILILNNPATLYSE